MFTKKWKKNPKRKWNWKFSLQNVKVESDYAIVRYIEKG